MKRARGFGTIGDLRLRGGEDPGSTVQIPGSLLDAGFMVKEKANLGNFTFTTSYLPEHVSPEFMDQNSSSLLEQESSFPFLQTAAHGVQKEVQCPAS